MAGTALPGRLSWQTATVVERVKETPRCVSIVLEHPGWAGHQAGQHVDVRLTAEDGYEAERSYSIASGPEDKHLVLTVERIEDGEVSPYLVDELAPGDQLELRGPIGGYFVWEASPGTPVLMVAGGSGVVPFRAMLHHWRAAARETTVRLLYSSRTLKDVIYLDELRRLAVLEHADIRLVLTRDWSADWPGYRGRINSRLLSESAWSPTKRPRIYLCGPNAFVETMADTLVRAGHDPGQIRTERFGPTGV